jgi:hypothetical protein
MDEVIVNVVEQIDEVVVNVQEETSTSTLTISESNQLVTLNITENPSEVNVSIIENKQEVNISIINQTPGSGGDLFYEHNQLVPLSSWEIEHNLSKYPSVTIVDSGGTIVIGDVVYNSENKVTVTFGSAFSGKAYFN